MARSQRREVREEKSEKDGGGEPHVHNHQSASPSMEAYTCVDQQVRCVLTQFNAGDPQGPDVHLPLVLALIHGEDHFWSHPKDMQMHTLSLLRMAGGGDP